MARKPDSHHVLPLWCDDLIASCVDMTPACFGAYMRLLCYAWTRGSIPDDEAACSRIAGGMEPGDWVAIRDRLVELDRGKLTHQRLELERVAVAALKEKRAESGRQGGRPKANGKQNKSETEANGNQNVSKPEASGKQNESKTKAPTPTPSPTPSPDHGRENTTRHGGEAGWGLDEWERFVGVWNRTARAKPWTPLLPPDGWIDHAASPGWLSKAHDAMSRLPACEWFTQPVAVTRFFEYVDRILAGEFDTSKQDGREQRKRQPAGGNL